MNEYGGLLVDLLPALGFALNDLSERVSTGRFEDSHANLRTYSMAAQRILKQAKGSKIDTSFPSYASEILGKGESAGGPQCCPYQGPDVNGFGWTATDPKVTKNPSLAGVHGHPRTTLDV